MGRTGALMFGRRKKDVEITDADVEGFVDDLSPEERAQEDAELERELDGDAVRAELPHPQGPWDEADAPQRERIDLGALQIAVPPSVELRLELSPEGQVMAATLVH